MILTKIEQEARKQNGWEVIGFVRMPERNGTVPYGYLAVDRGRSPSGREGGSFATCQWAEQSTGMLFGSGHYDLTREEALADLAERGRVGY